ncbi:hypothetical protein [Parasitella parasitica]|uniref:Uncharacterized protein n=1 Tax=Parasitella parasitica TaxID=35722 RepID=A0A0B7NFA1_9FUNG|nr:hypothetical protein [Parasitella parasitica]
MTYNQDSTPQSDLHFDGGYSHCPPPPSYNQDQQEGDVFTYNDDKRLRMICSEQEDPSVAPQAPREKQTEELHESTPYDQRRVGCLSLFWFAVICDVAATVIALLGTMGATLKCRSSCGYVCDLCNNKSRKGLIASLVIFIVLSSSIAVCRLTCCCISRHKRTKRQTFAKKATEV